MGSAKKVAMANLGCDKNRIDSEVMLGLLQKAGFLITAEEKKADIIIVNTCAFINEAKEESIDMILSLAQNKNEGNCKSLIVAGCLAQRYPEILLQEMPEIDAVVGTGEVAEIVHLTNSVLNGERVCAVGEPGYAYRAIYPRVLTTPGHYAYMKIADGCNNRCAYCIIPQLRGVYRSRPHEEILTEAIDLAKSGVKELILVAQDTTNYGVDLYGELKLPFLLQQLCKIKEIEWIRFLYAYPNLITDELLEIVSVNEKVCAYFDIPMQHASGKILHAMGRGGSQDKLICLVERLRERIPGVVVRSTFIVGYPGETEKDFQDLLEYMRKVKLDHVGVFPYSQEEGTPAAKLTGQIPEKIKMERYRRAMELQAEISYNNNLKYITETKRVLVEKELSYHEVIDTIGSDLQPKKGQYYYLGRTEGNAPDVDGNVYFLANQRIKSGDFVRVLMVGAETYDLIGEMV